MQLRRHAFHGSGRLWIDGQCLEHDGRKSRELRGFGAQLAASVSRQRVEARFAVVVGEAPFRLDQSALFQSVQRGGERVFEDITGSLDTIVFT